MPNLVSECFFENSNILIDGLLRVHCISISHSFIQLLLALKYKCQYTMARATSAGYSYSPMIVKSMYRGFQLNMKLFLGFQDEVVKNLNI